MSLLEKIKLILHKRHLKKEMQKNKGLERSSLPFSQANRIGILFNASNKTQEDCVMKYVDRLRNKHKKIVTYIGFFNNKEETKVSLFKNYSLNDLSWILIPKNEDVNIFKTEPFDIVINFFEKPLIHGDYIMTLSKARFRIGRNTENTDAYELIINEKKKDDAHFIGLLDTYLKTFNEESNDPQPA